MNNVTIEGEQREILYTIKVYLWHLCDKHVKVTRRLLTSWMFNTYRKPENYLLYIINANPIILLLLNQTPTLATGSQVCLVITNSIKPGTSTMMPSRPVDILRAFSIHEVTTRQITDAWTEQGWRSRDATVVGVLASHQCDPGLIPRPAVICGLSLLLGLFPAPRVFLRVLRFSSLLMHVHFITSSKLPHVTWVNKWHLHLQTKKHHLVQSSIIITALLSHDNFTTNYLWTHQMWVVKDSYVHSIV